LEETGTNRFHRKFMHILHLNKSFATLAALVSGMAIMLAMDPGRLAFKNVDAGGHPLRMLISGQGSPAVVFEAGGSPVSGSPLEAWNQIQPAVSRYTTTVSYDRAGIGWSPAGPGFRDARRVAIDLHTALHNADVRPPYLLVGHSFGGPLNRVFAGMYPNEVCGMVLVDPTQEEMIKWSLTHDTNNADAKRQDEEWKEIMASLDEAHASRVPPGIPVVLITGMGPKIFPSFIGENKVQEYRENHKRWLKFHQEWVDKIPGSKHIIDENTGHDIPVMEPQIVIDAISNAIAQVKSSADAPGKPAL
jgi:pimeloyl-ACP methyl ester carboxylesterase